VWGFCQYVCEIKSAFADIKDGETLPQKILKILTQNVTNFLQRKTTTTADTRMIQKASNFFFSHHRRKLD
jgi:hypothetical protein